MIINHYQIQLILFYHAFTLSYPLAGYRIWYFTRPSKQCNVYALCAENGQCTGRMTHKKNINICFCYFGLTSVDGYGPKVSLYGIVKADILKLSRYGVHAHQQLWRHLMISHAKSIKGLVRNFLCWPNYGVKLSITTNIFGYKVLDSPKSL